MLFDISQLRVQTLLQDGSAMRHLTSNTGLKKQIGAILTLIPTILAHAPRNLVLCEFECVQVDTHLSTHNYAIGKLFLNVKWSGAI